MSGSKQPEADLHPVRARGWVTVKDGQSALRQLHSEQERLGLTDTQLAGLSVVSQSTIHRAHRGSISDVRVVTMLGIAAGVGASVRLHDVREPAEGKRVRSDLTLRLVPVGSAEASDPVAVAQELRTRLRAEFLQWKEAQGPGLSGVYSLAHKREFSESTAAELLHNHGDPRAVRGTVTSFAQVAAAFGLALQLRTRV